MRQIIYSAILMFIFSVTFFYGQTVRKDIKILLETNQVRFLKEFRGVYTFPDNEKILNVITTNYDFAQTSLLISLEDISNNSFSVKIKSLELSNFIIPGIRVTTVRENKTNEFLTPEYPVVQNPLAVNITNKAPIEDIFAIRDYFLLYVIIAAALIISLISFVIFRLLKRKNYAMKDQINEKTDPYDDAITSLNRIKDINLDENNSKEIFVEISETIRRFIERIFKINALEMSTSEIMGEFKNLLKSNASLSELCEIVFHIFRMCDRVKYAKFLPENEHKHTAIEESFDFVNLTRGIFSIPVGSEDAEGEKK